MILHGDGTAQLVGMGVSFGRHKDFHLAPTLGALNEPGTVNFGLLAGLKCEPFQLTLALGPPAFFTSACDFFKLNQDDMPHDFPPWLVTVKSIRKLGHW
jgi:hypothetical protein